MYLEEKIRENKSFLIVDLTKQHKNNAIFSYFSSIIKIKTVTNANALHAFSNR